MLDSIFVPKGTAIGLGTLATNRSKTIWGEDALEWKPERWLQPLPREVLEAHIPGIYANLYVPGSSMFGSEVSDICICGAVQRSPAAGMRACEFGTTCDVPRSLNRCLAEVLSSRNSR